MTRAWHVRSFDELSARELYAIIALRERVFVVEQRCTYLDADGADPMCHHLWCAEADAVLAYCRLVPAGVKFPEASIGRVITAPEARRTGLGRELMRRALERLGPVPIRIAAQVYLERFYEDFGFVRAGEDYLEDDIPHVDMLRAIPRA